MKLTGHELHNDLEALHHIATRGWTDIWAYRTLYGRTPTPIYRALIAIGHPIHQRRQPKGLEWWWDPQGIFSSRRTGTT